ncbi:MULTISPECIES: hypothetical protein [unclassified Sulfitobacter]|jgi:hypothetical protein|uniref:hypothetical protein n=1 Tax=unclassified Sulfitobacter TaxID=196795 RepID=UPI0007C38A1B|nr:MULTISPECIES: hypothetical protein [unclassified Sulfitobacter]KZY05233.1 hypothetical protein A3721_14980 [Sulfitobacter sp. HI0023]KZY25621.1 hypothetical protein A3728_18350 [Sulfitobacter sp. HI0040]KZZ66202.1 hypothetical protein A3764_17615 [Sulfitobacter sp. HI0129]
MSLSVGLHNITGATATGYTLNGKKCGTVYFEDDSGQEVEMHMPPHVAKELARTFERASEVIQRDGFLFYRGDREWEVYEGGFWHGKCEDRILIATTLFELLDRIDATEAKRLDDTAA